VATPALAEALADCAGGAMLRFARYRKGAMISGELVSPDKQRPLRRAEYERLVELGSFQGEKLELLYGRLIIMSPQGVRHAFSITRLTMVLARALGDRANVRVQLPFAASDDSEPEPDLAVVPAAEYLDEHPKQAFLIIEVSESSVDEDRRLKAPLYAGANVPEYWIVDLCGGVVEVHAEPIGGVYKTVKRRARDARLAVPGFADVVVAVGDVLPSM
jgi:Uma2 family endonuclease